jgi:hypothetical protein
LPRVVRLLNRDRSAQRGEVEKLRRILARSAMGREGSGVACEVRMRLPGRVLWGVRAGS